MAFDDILGIPISFEDKEEKKPTVVEKKKDVWDTEQFWSLDLDEIWKADDDDGEPVKGREPDTPKSGPTTVEEDLPRDPDVDYDEDEDDLDLDLDDLDLDLDDFDEDDAKDDEAKEDVSRQGGNRPTTDPNLLAPFYGLPYNLGISDRNFIKVGDEQNSL